MPKFLSKLFRRKPSSEAPQNPKKKDKEKDKGKSKKSKKQNGSVPSPGREITKSTQPQALGKEEQNKINDIINRQNGVTSGGNGSRGGHEYSAKNGKGNDINGRGPVDKYRLENKHHGNYRQSYHSTNRVLSPRNQVPNEESTAKTKRESWGGPVDLDDSDIDDLDRDENVDSHKTKSGSPIKAPLSAQQLHKFDMQQHNQKDGRLLSPTNGVGAKISPTMFHMSTDDEPKNSRFSAGHVPVDDMNRSDASSSDFNLSTDAEDTEYENMKRRGVMPGHYPPQLNSSNLDASTISGVSSPTNYNTDGEHSIFPALQTDDELASISQSVRSIPQSQLPPQILPPLSYPQEKLLSPPQPQTQAQVQTPAQIQSQPKDQSPPHTQSQIQSPAQTQSQVQGHSRQNQVQAQPPTQAPIQVQAQAQLQSQSQVHSPTPAQSRLQSPTQMEPPPQPQLQNQHIPDDEFQPTKNVPNPTPEDEQRRRHVVSPKAEESERAWVVSPRNSSNDNPVRSSKKSSSFTFSTDENRNFNTSGDVTTSTTPRRNFTSPKVAPTNSFNDNGDGFANFADFSNVTFPSDMESWGPNKIVSPLSPSKESKIIIEADKPFDAMGSGGNGAGRSSASLTNEETNLSELLAQAKEKRNSNKSSKDRSSVNSAPAITPQYLRQYHNLRPRGSERQNPDSTSVSDIIDSLEVANASRAKTSRSSTRRGSPNDQSDGHSTNSHGTTSGRSTKERLREKRRKERERDYNSSSKKYQSKSPEMDSSDGSDNEHETWLFDEVTGALGPRGIAADLESLSGRSNRSKSSAGNRSHKSHKSHRSHRSASHRSRRRQKSSQKQSSSESVDSRGSRHSRNSRSSRYSHRSTRSYLSQMSEQSRSVANDLLRLEMQLAMVGSQDTREEQNTGRTGAGSSVSGAASVSNQSRGSRKGRVSTTRRSSGIARRSKVNIVAPPGKLGIILANKADSKGTVVSGVRTSSVLAEKISPGDRIVAIDGEDVSLMTVSEITTIMARKSDFERTLTVLTTPKHMSMGAGASATAAEPMNTPLSHTHPVHSPSKSAPITVGGDYDSYRYNRS